MVLFLFQSLMFWAGVLLFYILTPFFITLIRIWLALFKRCPPPCNSHLHSGLKITTAFVFSGVGIFLVLLHLFFLTLWHRRVVPCYLQLLLPFSCSFQCIFLTLVRLLLCNATGSLPWNSYRDNHNVNFPLLDRDFSLVGFTTGYLKE